MPPWPPMHPAGLRCSSLAYPPVCALLAPCRAGASTPKDDTPISARVLSVSFGSLFPALHRMEERGWVTAEWRASANNGRAKYYRLTDRGRAQVDAEERDWHRVVRAMKTAIESARNP